MQHITRRLLAGAAVVGAAMASPAFAAVLDFESGSLTNLYLPGDTFAQSGYTFSVLSDYGIVDVASSLGEVAPSGNATQFYFNSNDGKLRLALTAGGAFNLDGFSAAFVPLVPASSQTTVIVATGTKTNGSTVTASWSFASSLTSNFPFTAYSGVAFSAFTGLTQVTFSACSLVGASICTVATANNGQFAIDNISVTPVPEPTTALLMTLGVIGLGLRARRAVR